MIRLIVIFTILLPSFASGATIWCNPSNIGAETGATKDAGYNTLWEAMSAMQSGDEIIIANGDWSTGYSGMSIDNDGHLPPSGTSFSSMSTIRAETDWTVKLPGLWDDGVGASYIKIQGIVFMSSKGNSMYGWNHVEFIRCGFFAPKLMSNSATFSFTNGTYNLVEDCIAWGGGRYKFLDYHGNFNIFRRCVARHDWYKPDTTLGYRIEQQANFRGYGQKNSLWQNCISIDSDRVQFQPGPVGEAQESADFWIGDQSGAGGNKIEGSIVVKGMFMAYYLGGSEITLGDVHLMNTVALGPGLVGVEYLTGAITYGAISPTISNSLFINFNTGYQHFVSHNKSTGVALISNSIVRDVGSLWSAVTADYNYYYNQSTGNYGSNSVHADPLTNGLMYPVRIEAGSNLATAGIGPTILKKIGVSGTHFGDVGYDTVTGDNLWPFPNESIIKSLMSTTVDGVGGVYGFTSGTSIDGSPQTLTKYIWEQFGNQIPSDIYNAGRRYRYLSITGD